MQFAVSPYLRGGVWGCMVYGMYACMVYELYRCMGPAGAAGQCVSAVWLYVSSHTAYPIQSPIHRPVAKHRPRATVNNVKVEAKA